MNKLAILLVSVCNAVGAYGQKTFETHLLNPDLIPVQYHGITGRLDEYREDSSMVNEITKTEKIGYHPKNDWPLNPTTNPNALPQGLDHALQTQYAPFDPNKSVVQSFNGMGYSGVNPADPSVDVGPNHVVQMINGASGAYIQIYNKSTLATMLPANTYFDNFMAMAGGAGDPIVMYDERADRWVLTEFSASGNNMHVAISTTPDPTGTYYKYTFNAPNFPDYPKYSIWENSYIITTNEAGTSPCYALNRTALLAGTPSTAQRFTLGGFGTIGFQAGTPVSLNGTTNPPAGTPAMIMRMRDDAWTGAASDALEIWEFDIDFVTPANTTLTLTNVLPIAAYASELCGYTSFACFDQPTGTVDLDPLRELLMNRIHYRNFGTHESMVCVHVADVDGTDHGGLRWYELRRTGGTAGTWVIYQQGTYSPDAADRWMASIGISATGDILMAYNVVDNTSGVYPSLRYTGRKACDPLNMMTMPEAVIVAGAGSNASNRYGDYNQMGLDPSDGQTFWFTGMYNPASQWSTRIAALTVDGGCAPEVSFGIASATAAEEDANVANGCLDYYVVNVPISIALDPSQPANVDVVVNGTSSATQGVDFDLINTAFVFDGATLSGTVEVRVYNDNYVEGVETIILDYTLNANGGDAAAGSFNQQVTITVNDNDLDPASMVNVQTVHSQDFESGFGTWTTNNAAGGAANLPFQIGDAAAATSTYWVVPTTNATDFAYVNDDDCNCTMANVYLTSPVISLAGLSNATLSFDSFFEGNTYSGDTETGVVQFSTNGGGSWAGTTNIIVGAAWNSTNINLAAYLGQANFRFRFRYQDDGGWMYGLAIDNVAITTQGPIDIQQAVNTGSAMSANLGPNETVHFYDPATNDVMMTLENSSSWDYGCVDVEVDRDGTAPSALQFTTTNTPDYLHSKTFRVVPTNSNPTGTFNVTLYYKEAEVAAWEAATGNSRNNAEVIKVAGNNRIQDVNPGNYTTFTIDNVLATLGTFNGDVTFTAPFTNGFSGFGVGIYPLGTPVTHTAALTPPSCNGFADGQIVITASGGDGNYTYSINNGVSFQGSNTFTGLTAGTYNVIVMDGLGATSTMSVEVLNDPAVVPAPTAGSNSPICAGSNLNLTASTVTGATYSWTGPNGFTSTSQNPTITGATTAATGTYNVTATVSGCTSSAGSTSVTVNAVPSAPTAGSNSPICAGANLNLTASTVTGATYSWTGPNGFTSTSQNPTITSATTAATGTYNVTATVSGCTSSAGSTSVTVNAVPSAPTAGSNSPICAGANLNLTASTVTGATYSWTGPNGFTSTSQNPTITGATTAASGTYSVTATVGGCTSSAGNVSVTVNAIPSAPTVGSNSPICAGANLNLTASTVTGATYSWTGPNGFTSSFQNPFVTGTAAASSGTYSVTATVAGCASAPATTNVTVNPAPTFTIGTTANPSACATADGSIQLNGLLPSTSYSVSYSDGGTPVSAGSISTNGAGVLVISGLSAGSYGSFALTLAGCTGTVAGPVALTDPAAPTVTVSGTDPSAPLACDGTVTAIISGGTSPYGVVWDDPLTQTTTTATALCEGTYCATVTDAGGCVSSGCGTINDPGCGLTVTPTSTDMVCNGDANGTISFAVSGQSGSVSYSIDGGATIGINPNFTGLAPGTYNWVVQDQGGCLVDGTIVLNDPAPVTYTATVVNTDCASNTGELHVVGSGGTGTLQYSINGGFSFQSVGSYTGLGGAAYPILVIDANACTATGTEVISVIGLPIVDSVTTTNVTCNGGADGNITIWATTTTAPVVYSIDGGNTFQINNPVFSNVPFGSYNIVVLEVNGCQTVSTAFVNEPGPVQYSATVSDENCGLQDGELAITTLNGVAPFQFSIDGGTTFQSSATFTGLAPGLLNVVVQDAHGCNETSTEVVGTLSGPSIEMVTVTEPLCFMDANGELSVVANGTAPFEYSIDHAQTFQSSDTFSGLATGLYMVTIADANGCRDSVAAFLGQPDSITLTMSSSVAPCSFETGTAVSAASGGTAPYTYMWNDALMQTTPQAIQLAPGIYTVHVTDANGCMTMDSVVVTGTDSLFVEYEVTHESCDGFADGSIVTYVSGGSGSYAFVWSSGDTTSSIQGLEDGGYILQVSDASGCEVTALIEVRTENEGCLEIPTAISPNNDGNNDSWIITGIDLYPEARIEIYNKWGNLLYESTGYDNTWNGEWQGAQLPAAVYYYIVTISEEEVYTGSITLIR